jgi:hypothetical protein
MSYTICILLLICCPDVDLNRAFLQAVGRRGRGRQDIDLHLLKPARFRPEPGWALPPAVSDRVIHDDVLDPAPEWMSYEYRTTHPVLRWLPTKLAEWIGANLSEELLIPDKIEDKWTAAELNSILLNNVVRGPFGHLRTFGGIQWECDLFNGRPKARCYPFNIVGHRFRDKNPQVVLQYRIRCRIRYRIRYLIRYIILHHIRSDMTFCIFSCVSLTTYARQIKNR